MKKFMILMIAVAIGMMLLLADLLADGSDILRIHLGHLKMSSDGLASGGRLGSDAAGCFPAAAETSDTFKTCDGHRSYVTQEIM